MEPLSIIAISAGVGAVSTKVVDRAWDSGEKWLKSYFKDHQENVQQTAKQNSLQFLADLAQKVNELEKQAASDPDFQKSRESSLQDPDFSALLKDALITSARTGSEVKHQILGRIVSERLRVPSEDLVALTSTLACEAVGHLTTKQLNFLGLAVLTYFLRPNPFPPPDLPTDHLGRFYFDWLAENLQLHSPQEVVSTHDLTHLESVSCLSYIRIATAGNLKKVLTPTHMEDDWPFEDLVQKDPNGKVLMDLWEAGMESVTLTTTGQLIGTYVHDQKTNTRTTIPW